MGVVIRRYIDFLILLIPTPLVYVPFCNSIHTFCSCFSFLLEERRMPNVIFYFARYVHKLRYYSDVIHSFNWISAIEHNGSV